MSNTATPAAEDTLLADLSQRMNGKSNVEKAEMLRTFAKEHYKVEIPTETPVVQLTDEQIRFVVSEATRDAQNKVTEEVTLETQRKYNVNHGEAKELAEEKVHSTFQRHKRQQEECKLAAEVFRAIAHASKGEARPGELHEAYQKEGEYMRKTYGRETRAMSLGTDSTGGYLAPEVWSSMLYENISRYSLARKYATIVQMDGEILRLPTLTATVTATQDSEAATISGVQPTFGQFTLTTKKLSVLSNPFSIELMEKANPALVQAITNWATIAIAVKEDALVFQTSSPGILNSSTNNVTMGSGKTAITDVDFDDMADLIDGVAEQYTPDEDIQGSGMIGGTAKFWFNKKLKNVLAKSKGNDNYHWANVQELKQDKQVHGFDLKRVVSMSSAPSISTKFGCFGNLGYVWCGVVPGFRINLLSEGPVGGVNLGETGQYAVRVIEFFDNAVIDANAFSILKTAAA